MGWVGAVPSSHKERTEDRQYLELRESAVRGLPEDRRRGTATAAGAMASARSHLSKRTAQILTNQS